MDGLGDNYFYFFCDDWNRIQFFAKQKTKRKNKNLTTENTKSTNGFMKF